MAYSCTDFADDVLNDMVIRSWIKPEQYGPEDTQAQCDAVLGAIGVADVSLASLDYSLKWLERLRGMPCRMLIAVQNGMQVDDVASLLSPAVGIFVGGSTEWKEQTAHVWGSLARRRHCYLHVGRVNSARRIRICAAAGADSFDGTSVSRYAKTLPRLDRATRQADMFAAAHDGLEEAQRATADVLI